MAKITRKKQKILGLSSAQTGQFGSARAGTFVLDTDPDVIQALPAWESGWATATTSGGNLPTIEERQGVDFVATRQLAYIFQEGIPEYDATTEYHQNSIVKETGTVKLYKSKTNSNTGNVLSNATHWQLLVNLSSVQPLDNYTATVDPTVNDDSGDGYSQGSTWFNSVSGDFFMCVTATVGAANWVDTGLNISDLGSAAFLNAGAAIGNVLLISNIGGVAGLPAINGSLLTDLPAKKLLHIQDQKSSGTDGGTFTAGSWVTRTLNTEVFDTIGSTLSSNQFTLPAGTYQIKATAPAFAVSQHQLRLQNITDATTVGIGTNELTNAGSGDGSSRSEIVRIFTISATKTFEIQHKCTASKTTNGLGVNCSFGTEIYSEVLIEKL